MRSAMQSDKKGLTARDLVTCGVFIALYFVFMMVGSMLFAPNPVLTFLMPAGAALLTGPIYLLLVAKVPKHGPIIILGVVEGLIMFVTGMYWLWAVALVVLGVVADLIAGAGRFRNKNLNLVSFLVFSLNPWGPTSCCGSIRRATPPTWPGRAPSRRTSTRWCPRARAGCCRA